MNPNRAVFFFDENPRVARATTDFGGTWTPLPDARREPRDWRSVRSLDEAVAVGERSVWTGFDSILSACLFIRTIALRTRERSGPSSELSRSFERALERHLLHGSKLWAIVTGYANDGEWTIRAEESADVPEALEYVFPDSIDATDDTFVVFDELTTACRRVEADRTYTLKTARAISKTTLLRSWQQDLHGLN